MYIFEILNRQVQIKCLHVSSFAFVFQHMKRTGWVKRNIPDPETIAGHMYRMAMLSFLVDGKENLDKTK